MNLSDSSRSLFRTLQVGGVGVAVVGLLLTIFGVVTDLEHFYQVYLIAFLFWIEVSLGCLGFFLLLNIVQGGWGFAVKRIMAAGARTIPVMGLLFIPLLFSLGRLYPWANGEVPLEGAYGTYHSIQFFVIRVVLYFIIWGGLAYVLSNWSYQIDETGDIEQMRRIQRWSAGGMVLFMITVTFAMFDWVMSLHPEWFSTISGWLGISRQAIAAFTLAIILLTFVWDEKPMKKLITDRIWKDLSTLQVVVLLVWMYMSAMQFFIMWHGNQPSKIKWYLPRIEGPWQDYIVFIVIAHAIPLVLLLTPGLKRIRPLMVVIAGWLFVMRLVDMYWLVMPEFESTIAIRWWDFALVLAFGGAWIAVFAWSYSKQAIVPAQDPELESIVGEETMTDYRGAVRT
jgi:hypothetical protein